MDLPSMGTRFGQISAPPSARQVKSLDSHALEPPIRYCRKFLEGERCERKVSVANPLVTSVSMLPVLRPS